MLSRLTPRKDCVRSFPAVSSSFAASRLKADQYAEHTPSSSTHDSSTVQQLKHQAGLCGEDGIRPSPVPGVFMSDSLLDEEVQQQVLAGLKPLEDVPDDQKDWHPGSDQQARFANPLAASALVYMAPPVGRAPRSVSMKLTPSRGSKPSQW